MEVYDAIAAEIAGGNARAALAAAAAQSLRDGNFGELFEVRLLAARHELGLRLVQTEPLTAMLERAGAEKREAYERAFADAAREAGMLYLDAGEIGRAYPFLKAVDELGPVREALERGGSSDAVDRLVEIAFIERVHPRKGFELVLQHYGLCRAITYFEQYPDAGTRGDALEMLLRALYAELTANLRAAIEAREGAPPPQDCAVPELLAGRDWLFGEFDYYVDTSHLISALRFATDIKNEGPRERELLQLAIALTEYGDRLSAQFRFRMDPPFEGGYADYRIYLRALLGQDVEGAVRHFCAKVEEPGAAPAVLKLLVTLERYDEAIALLESRFTDTDPEQYGLPGAARLHALAHKYGELMALAREKNDVVLFTAAALEARNR